MARNSYKKVAKSAKKHPVFFGVLAIIVVIILAAAAILWVVKPELYHNYLGIGDHNFGKWEELEKADCEKDGKRRRECLWCGEIETETVKASGHDWSDVNTVVAPTCGVDGEGYIECNTCHERRDLVISMTEKHVYNDGEIIVPATCKDGEMLYTCTVCGKTETEIIAGSGNHTFGEWQTVKAASCGDGERVRKCSVCDKTESEIITGSGNHSYGADGTCTVCGEATTSAEMLIKTSDFSVHFLELGNNKAGDCVLIKCGQTEVLIDAGSAKNSAVTIKSYLDEYVEGDLDYVITTHADQDHISAYVGTGSGTNRTGILYQYKVGTIIKFSVTTKTTAIYNDYLAAVSYAESQGTKVYTAKQCYDETDGAKRQYYLDDAHTISMNILYNYYYYNKSSDENNHSVVTLFTQELAGGNKHYLFTGDLEKDGESRMVDYYQKAGNSKSAYDILPEVELYKAGHHGSKTSSTSKLLQVIKPKYVAVCCCCGSPEYTVVDENMFPTKTMLDNVLQYTDKIYVTSLATDVEIVYGDDGKVKSKKWNYTSMNGDIVFYSRGGNLNVHCSASDATLTNTDWYKEHRLGSA